MIIRSSVFHLTYGAFTQVIKIEIIIIFLLNHANLVLFIICYLILQLRFYNLFGSCCELQGNLAVHQSKIRP